MGSFTKSPLSSIFFYFFILCCVFLRNVSVIAPELIISTTTWLQRKMNNELEALLKMNDPQDIIDFCAAAITVLNTVNHHNSSQLLIIQQILKTNVLVFRFLSNTTIMNWTLTIRTSS